jgi:hypothetical protein
MTAPISQNSLIPSNYDTEPTYPYPSYPIGLYESYEQLHETQERNIRSFSEKILNNPLYGILYHHPIFQEVTEGFIERSFPDIDMDDFIIIPSTEVAIGTCGAATCFAICFRGRTNEGQSFIGIAHTSHVCNMKQFVLPMLKNKMIERGCMENTIEFFVLGGVIVADEPGTNSIETMEETLVIAEEYNIKGIRFNHSVNGFKDFNVLMTADKIYYSTKVFFDPIYDAENEQTFFS